MNQSGRSMLFSSSLLLLMSTTALPQESPDALLARARTVLAQLEGELQIQGLKEPVEILRDRWGIAHIYARNEHDLFFAQGLVAAQDRLFQLDLWRRVGRGETAELFGQEGIEADRFARLVRYRGDMEAEWNSYAPDAREIAAAFTDGINAYIDHLGPKLPIEFQLLGYAPQKWRPEDVVGRMSGIIMTSNWQREVARARLIAAAGIDQARLLAPTDPPRDFAPAGGIHVADITTDVFQGYLAASRVLKFSPSTTESNNWVVDGSLSASGKPLLASDPHRAIALPSLRYLVHLHAPGWNVIGSGEPALPGVALGHNERIAWGFTIVGTDQADLYVEQTHPDDPRQYQVGDRFEPMRILRESIRVRGRSEPHELELRFTRHGPVIYQDEKKHLAFALRWAGSEPGGAAYLGSLSVARAQNRLEFVKALEAWKIPCLNFVYADVDGDIGWVAAALTPIRKDGTVCCQCRVPGKYGGKGISR
jgi:penicillin amidase